MNYPVATPIEAQRRIVADLAQVLVHDCLPHSERCYCFGEGDVTAYETAKAKLAEMMVCADCGTPVKFSSANLSGVVHAGYGQFLHTARIAS